MAIYYKGKKVASNRNVNHKDFVDCRDVEFTNPQDGDVPTWDSTAQKLVNRAAHGLYEVWANSSLSSAFAGQTIQVTTDKSFDAFIYECGISDNQNSAITVIGESSKTARIAYLTLSTDGTIQQFFRTVTPSKTLTGYDFVFVDCTRNKRSNDGTMSTGSTQNGYCVPFRIYGIIHND